MKTLTLLLLILSFNTVAQKSDIFNIDSLPTEGVLLNKGWKFHAGDNLDFAKVEFDDSGWESINPTLDVHDTLPQIPRPSGICWFRLHLSINKNVLKNPLALRISQSGASEIYKNGVYLRHFGVLSTNPNVIKAFDPLNKPITFNVERDTNIVLAVRYTLQPNVHYTMLLARQNPALQIRLNDSERAFNQYSNREIRGSDSKKVRVGIFFIICILFLSYYLYDPQQKANLYFSFYALLVIICEIVSTTPNAVDKIYYHYNIGLDGFQISAFLLLTALYFLLNQKRTWIYWSLMGLTILGMFVNAGSYHLGNILSSTYVGSLINIEIIRITFKSIKFKKRGAWIIAAGGICFAVFWIAFLSSTPFFLNYWLTPFLNTIFTVGDVLYNVASLSIPVAVSVYMGLDIANTNLLLRQKLVEVEALSAEKQQILATQNETLEKQVHERTAELEHKNRDLEIEGALEKIRSTSLAMRHSGEIKNVVTVLFEKLKELNLVFDAAAIHVFKEGSKNAAIWVASPEQLSTTTEINLPYDEDDFINNSIILDVWHAKETGKAIFNKIYLFEEKNRYFNYVFKHNDYEKIPKFARNLVLNAECYTASFVAEKNSLLGINSWTPQLFSQTDFDILKRIARVFEQAYVRFLDLQKAEAQAREAQIETALERVRSRTMAMQKSDELREAANLLSKEVRGLGVPVWSCGYNIMEKDEKACLGWMSTEGVLQPSFRIPLKVSPTFIKFYESRQNGVELFEEKIGGTDLETHYNYMLTLDGFADILKGFISSGHQLPTFQVNTVVNFTQGNLIFISAQPVPEAYDIFKRFAYVFEQTFTRFLDLQKAEAQAREAQIEAALEKIRSQSLAMHHSGELKEVITIMSEKLRELNVLIDSVSIQLFDEKTQNSFFWVGSDLNDKPRMIYLPYDETIFNEDTYLKDSWEAKTTGQSIINKKYSLEQKNKYFEYVFANNDLTIVPQPVRDFIMQAQSHITCLFIEKKSSLFADSWNGQVYSEDKIEVLRRVAKVFEQAYIRFLDLQKAEAQAREAQIEVALERVRSKTMAMHHSNQLREIAATTLEQLQSLGFTYGACSIVIMDAVTGDMIWWISGFENEYPKSYNNTYFEHPFYLEQLNNWKEGKKYAVMVCEGEAKKAYDEYVFSKTDFVNIPEELQKIMQSFEKITFSNAYMKHGALSWSTEPLDDEYAKILQRFASVFEQSYTRFLDLQKAEAQAREAQIEVSLERIRAKTSSMQSSNELSTIIGMIYLEMGKLNVHLQRCFFMIFNPENLGVTWWMASGESLDLGQGYFVKHSEHPPQLAYFKGWEERQETWRYIMQGAEKANWDAFLFHETELSSLPPFIIDNMKSFKSVHLEASFNAFGCLTTGNEQPIGDEAFELLIRFSKVFDLTYTRFSDLKKAEAQAREAQIELALERVRAKAMSMQTSEELNAVIGKIFVECKSLDIQLDASVIIIYDEQTYDTKWYLTNHEDPDYPARFRVPHNEYPFNIAMLHAWHQKTIDWNYMLDAQEKKEWDKFVFSKTDFVLLPDNIKEVMAAVKELYIKASFNEFGCLMLTSLTPLNNEQMAILPRFSKVFELTYTRFNDLKQAEAQAKEAKIEASFERIRASALAMQTSDEFLGVVRTLYEQINALGQKELEATIIQFYQIEEGFINSWNAQNIDEATSGNITLGTARFPFDACRLTLEWLNAYKSSQEDYTIVAKGEILKEWLHFLMKMSPEIKSRLGDTLPETSNFHFSKFSEGALSMVSTKPFEEESKYLLKRAASAFDLAYKRYLDLQLKEEQALKLSQEKQRLETALKELQATQDQLIQKEKLASLGELTAGIAHEIQNPLNFVNNFSELSVDLVKDLKDELKRPDKDETYIGELFDDLSQNQEKINHHGKRASSIVKGMLEHSRASTGVKELTDINKLADEYLKLSYHGLRAKDNSLNADFSTDFGEILPKIEVIPQDMGRVLLNLINNAFYAVNLRKQLSEGSKPSESYTPSVSVTTQQLDKQIIIKVKDNGIGMNEATKAKVFQPFFTTKPTGQGTGLGLSLAYDIVTKGHGGTLEVESTEGVGSEFIITLPFKTN